MDCVQRQAGTWRASVSLEFEMEKQVGVWIDREKAFIVSLVDGETKITYARSDVPGHVQLSGGLSSSTPYGPQNISPERQIENRYRNKLHKYYKKVIHQTDDADHIFIFGPGEARIELKKEMRKSKERFAKITGVERADKMTEPQIVTKVKQFYHKR